MSKVKNEDIVCCMRCMYRVVVHVYTFTAIILNYKSLKYNRVRLAMCNSVVLKSIRNRITDLQGAIDFDTIVPVVIYYCETTNRILSAFFVRSAINYS